MIRQREELKKGGEGAKINNRTQMGKINKEQLIQIKNKERTEVEMV